MKTVQVRTRGEGGPKLAILLRTYFMEVPLAGSELVPCISFRYSRTESDIFYSFSVAELTFPGNFEYNASELNG